MRHEQGSLALHVVPSRLASGSDICHRADKFDAAGCIRHSTRRGMDMLDRAVGHQQSISVLEILALVGRTVDGPLYARAIIRMDTLQ